VISFGAMCMTRARVLTLCWFPWMSCICCGPSVGGVLVSVGVVLPPYFLISVVFACCSGTP